MDLQQQRPWMTCARVLKEISDHPPWIKAALTDALLNRAYWDTDNLVQVRAVMRHLGLNVTLHQAADFIRRYKVKIQTPAELCEVWGLNHHHKGVEWHDPQED